MPCFTAEIRSPLVISFIRLPRSFARSCLGSLEGYTAIVFLRVLLLKTH